MPCLAKYCHETSPNGGEISSIWRSLLLLRPVMSFSNISVLGRYLLNPFADMNSQMRSRWV